MPWLSTRSAAAYLDVGEVRFLALVKAGRLPGPRQDAGPWKSCWDSSEIDAAMLTGQPKAQARSARVKRGPRGYVVPTETLSREEIAKAAAPVPTFGCGIYFLMKDGEIVYVGQSVNVLSRLTHHLPEKAFDAWHWIPCDRGALDQLERRYIDLFLPPLNADFVTKRLRASRRD